MHFDLRLSLRQATFIDLKTDLFPVRNQRKKQRFVLIDWHQMLSHRVRFAFYGIAKCSPGFFSIVIARHSHGTGLIHRSVDCCLISGRTGSNK